MNAGFVLAAVIVGLSTVAFATLGDLVSEEIRRWLDLAPRAILWLAGAQLDSGQRETLYRDEWLPELNYVLRGEESRPITRIVRGVMFALNLLMAGRTLRKRDRRLEGLGRRLASASAWRITDLAAMIAGRKRLAMREEWPAQLTGEPGHELPARRKVAAAIGFVIAAIRYRHQDAADLAWIPADAVLKSRLLSSLVVGVPTVTAAARLFRHGGIDGVIASWESIAAIGGSLYTLIRVGRWWRGVKPPDPKVRRASE